MPEPFEKVVALFDTKEERDIAYDRKLVRDFMIVAHQRVIKKITRREGNKTLYGYEVKRA